MISPVFGLSLHVLFVPATAILGKFVDGEVVDGYAFTWWQVAGPKARGLWS
jgi:hypothetical protein